MAAASYASNIYKRFKKVDNLEQLVPVERLAVVVISVAAFLMSLSGGLVFDIALLRLGRAGGMFRSPGSSLPVLGKDQSPRSRGGHACGDGHHSGGGTTWDTPMFSYELIPGFAFSLMAMYGVSLGTGGASVASLQRFREFRTLLES